MHSTVLNVDDSPSALYVKSHCLRQAGLTVVEASSGREALLAYSNVGLAIIDAILPDIPGVEVCRSLRAQHPGLRIMMVSVKMRDPQEQARVLDAGADCFLAEPDSAVLVATAKSLLRMSGEAGAHPETGTGSERNSPRAGPSPELRAFAHKLAHDLREPLRAVRMLTSFILEDHGRALAPEVVERLQAIERNSAEVNRRLGAALLATEAAGSDDRS